MRHLVFCSEHQDKATPVASFANLDASIAFASHRFAPSVCLATDAALAEIQGAYTVLADRHDPSALNHGVICSHGLTPEIFLATNAARRLAFVLNLEGVLHHELRVSTDFRLEDALPLGELAGRHQALAFSADGAMADRWAYVYVLSLSENALNTLLRSGLRGYLLGFSVIDQQDRERLLIIDVGDSFDLILGQVDSLPDSALVARI